jgi:hypothetical protein
MKLQCVRIRFRLLDVFISDRFTMVAKHIKSSVPKNYRSLTRVSSINKKFDTAMKTSVATMTMYKRSLVVGRVFLSNRRGWMRCKLPGSDMLPFAIWFLTYCKGTFAVDSMAKN